jgi:hypothetical protein
MKREVLTKPFRVDQLRERPGPKGRKLRYVDVTAVIERLSEGCDQWSFEIVHHEVKDGEAIVLGKLTADGVIKTAFGGSRVTVDEDGAIVSIADDLKAAASDALKKAASMLGVGLELYGGASRREESSPRREREAPLRSPEPTRAPGERVTTRQLAALHAASRRRGVGSDELLSMVARQTGKRELVSLTRAQASGLISDLSSNGTGH